MDKLERPELIVVEAPVARLIIELMNPNVQAVYKRCDASGCGLIPSQCPGVSLECAEP